MAARNTTPTPTPETKTNHMAAQDVPFTRDDGPTEKNEITAPDVAAADATVSVLKDEYPEGGLKAWSVVLGCWFAGFSAFGITNAISTIHAYVGTHQLAGYSEGAVGRVFGVYMFLFFFCGIYVGPVFDKYGPRWLIFTGTVALYQGSE